MSYIGNIKIGNLIEQIDGKVYYCLKHKATNLYVSGIYRSEISLPDRKKSSGIEPAILCDENYDTNLHRRVYKLIKINNYKETKQALTKAKQYRQKLVNQNIIFLDDEDKIKLKNLNFKKMKDQEIFDFVKDFYEDKISYFKKSSYGLQKTQTINNSLFTENPSSLLHSFFENKFNFRYQDNLNSELASVIPRINEILDIFEIHKIEFGIKQDDLIDEEQLTTDLTVSIVNWNADK